MPQPFEVEFVGKECEWLIPLMGPFLIALGAFLAALLTIRTANKRHREQLEHDQELQEKRLEHDRELRGVQLAHDRFLRQMEATRTTIDDVTNELTNAMDALKDFTGDSVNAERYLREREESKDPAEREELHEAWNRAMIELAETIGPVHQTVERLRPAQLRLRLRFPEAHPVYRNYALVCSAVEQALALVARDEGEILSDELLAEMEESRLEVARRLTLYVEAVRFWNELPPNAEENPD